MNAVTQMKAARRKTEDAIQKLLQKLHDDTGAIPSSINFNANDVTTMGDTDTRVVISVVEINLTLP